jgi:hypothetical protein
LLVRTGSVTNAIEFFDSELANVRRGPRCPSWQLLPLDADHYRTGANHIEFNRCGAAHVDYATTAIRAKVYDTHDYCLAVVMVSALTFVPNGNVRWAAVSPFGPVRSPLAVRPPL